MIVFLFIVVMVFVAYKAYGELQQNGILRDLRRQYERTEAWCVRWLDSLYTSYLLSPWVGSSPKDGTQTEENDDG
jgi:hypothetical protein